MLTFPSSLVTTDWLFTHLDADQLVILDATIPKVGQAIATDQERVLGIPQARFFDLKNVFKDLGAKMPNTVPKPDYFEQEVRKLGIHQDSKILVYDRHGVYSAPRAWCLFKVMGHQDVAVLNGGLPQWQEEDKPLADLQKYTGSPGNFVANYQDEWLISQQQVLATLEQENHLLLDARSAGRFYATAPEPRAELRGGHIPNSKSLPHTEVVKDGKLLPPKELEALFDSKDINGKKLTFSCGSGITACILALAADQIGQQGFTIYDGSWTEWASNLELPIKP